VELAEATTIINTEKIRACTGVADLREAVAEAFEALDHQIQIEDRLAVLEKKTEDIAIGA